MIKRRRLPESNRRKRLCRPLRSHSAKAPSRASVASVVAHSPGPRRPIGSALVVEAEPVSVDGIAYREAVPAEQPEQALHADDAELPARDRARVVGRERPDPEGHGVVVEGETDGRLVAGHDSSRSRVMELPVGDQLGDIAAEFRAVTGGWRTVNGFSGYEPASYDALRKASAAGSAAMFGAVRGEDLHVLVREDASELRMIVEEQPGAEQTGNGGGLRQYRIPAAPP